MGELVSDADIAFLHSLYPAAGLAPLSSQAERFVLLRIQGLSNPQAEKAVGYAKGTGAKMMARDDVRVIYEYVLETKMKDTRITREKLTSMLLDAHSHAVTATEEVITIKELGKMHDLYADDIAKREAKGGGGTTINIEGDLNLKQIGKMSDDELANLAGVIDLDPENYTVIHEEELAANALLLEGDRSEPGRPTSDTEYVPPGALSARARAAGVHVAARRANAVNDVEGFGGAGTPVDRLQDDTDQSARIAREQLDRARADADATRDMDGEDSPILDEDD